MSRMKIYLNYNAFIKCILVILIFTSSELPLEYVVRLFPIFYSCIRFQSKCKIMSLSNNEKSYNYIVNRYEPILLNSF